MKKRIILYADGGRILTDGEIYGRCIILAEGRDESEIYEIGEEEYAAHIEEAEKK